MPASPVGQHRSREQQRSRRGARSRLRNSGYDQSLPPVLIRSLKDPIALEAVRGTTKPASKPGPGGFDRTGLWRGHQVRRYLGLSARAMADELRSNIGMREFCGFLVGATPSHETLRRFAHDVAAEPVLARWARAVRAHGPGLRSRTPGAEEFELIYAALDPYEFTSELDRHGKPGRTGYRAEPMMRAVVMAAVDGKGFWADMTRHLEDGPEKAESCGFEPGRVPSCSTLRRFARKVARRLDLAEHVSSRMLAELVGYLTGFAEAIAVDRTFLRAHVNGRRPEPRSDPDARFGYSTKNRGKDGQELDIGYGLHVAVSATTGIAISGVTTAANVRETILLPGLLEVTLQHLPVRPFVLDVMRRWNSSGTRARLNAATATKSGAARPCATSCRTSHGGKIRGGRRTFRGLRTSTARRGGGTKPLSVVSSCSRVRAGSSQSTKCADARTSICGYSSESW